MDNILYLYGKGDVLVGINDAATYFLQKHPMTHKKLQKMCYFAQAWHLALLREPLFAEDFEAWVHGPVSPSLYQKYRYFGWQEINFVDSDKVIKFEENTADLLEAVFNTYDEFSGDDLENITHNEEPWLQARGSLEVWEPSSNIIDKNIMRDYYAEKYAQSQND